MYFGYIQLGVVFRGEPDKRDCGGKMVSGIVRTRSLVRRGRGGGRGGLVSVLYKRFLGAGGFHMRGFRLFIFMRLGRWMVQ